jgi:oligopeptide/dipeptide ABC transporter ATP-binding protein
MNHPLLEVENLCLSLPERQSFIPILNDVSFQLFPGETVGLVGESGSGKSMTASAILGLLPKGNKMSGRISFRGNALDASSHLRAWAKITATLSAGCDAPSAAPASSGIGKTIPLSAVAASGTSRSAKNVAFISAQALRGTEISLILQDPAQSLNPLIAIGPQLIEGLIYHKKTPKKEAWNRGIEWLHQVGIHNPSERMKQYPHELSGGMKQRVLIAMALICNPSLLIADEPTTALDPTVQIQILDLLFSLQQEHQLSILLITHDLGVVARSCHRAMVMYAGQIVESGLVDQLFDNPQHPYTRALLHSRKSLTQPANEQLYALEGVPPSPLDSISGCPFASRCPEAMKICIQKPPPREFCHQREVACWQGKGLKKEALT